MMVLKYCNSWVGLIIIFFLLTNTKQTIQQWLQLPIINNDSEKLKEIFEWKKFYEKKIGWIIVLIIYKFEDHRLCKNTIKNNLVTKLMNSILVLVELVAIIILNNKMRQ